MLIDGKGITLKVSQGGERSTAAIESLKVVAFDIAVLILALEGAASLPTFLLHDSPREADLGQSIYDRLFRFIQSLEDKARVTLYEPVATNAQLFADNLSCHWSPSMHTYQLTDKDFQKADIVRILEVFIPRI